MASTSNLSTQHWWAVKTESLKPVREHEEIESVSQILSGIRNNQTLNLGFV